MNDELYKIIANALKDMLSGEEEFENEEVGLIAKVNLARNCYVDREHCTKRLKELLKEFPDRKCKVYLLHGNLTILIRLIIL